ncbi:TetR/AcrR family transcriptional regulator [Labrenzia sp. DG1229]|uniref:TetR/AcrR family transcriptional regulator n=1 Tax=Labrenzia sp. DG1229 TaxID=681847 RepID=UPI00048D4F1B|nr:TetR/AcrR family transcriptional regulator [Labrenzia sp. DG1229]
MSRPTPNARDRILTAANKLFYSEGIRAVSLDNIAEKAGITKKTVYYHFKSKDDLVEAYLVSRDQPNLTLYRKWFSEADGGLPDKVAAIFLQIAVSARHPKWKGCGFLRTAAELANMPGHPAMKVGAAHKKKFEIWLTEEFQAVDLEQPEALARHIVLLLDGAFSTILVHRDADYAEAAGNAASALVLCAMQKGPVSGKPSVK